MYLQGKLPGQRYGGGPSRVVPRHVPRTSNFDSGG
jgi:hypothetical protein